MPPEPKEGDSIKDYVARYLKALEDKYKVQELIKALEMAKTMNKYNKGVANVDRTKPSLLNPKEKLLLCYAIDFRSKDDAISHCKRCSDNTTFNFKFTQRTGDGFKKAFQELLSESLNTYTGYLIEQYEEKTQQDLTQDFPQVEMTITRGKEESEPETVVRRVSHWHQLRLAFQKLDYYLDRTEKFELVLSLSRSKQEDEKQIKKEIIDLLKAEFPGLIDIN
jgi:hypothetical protein